MSLWEKWDQQKLEASGVKVHKKDLAEKFREEERQQDNKAKKFLIVIAVVVACIAAVFAGAVIEAVINGRKWNDTRITQLFMERQTQREGLSRGTR